MRRLTENGLIALISLFVIVQTASAQSVDDLAGRRVMFLGDSITHQGGYISMIEYVGYTRGKTVTRDRIDDIEAQAAEMLAEIDRLRKE
jgi:hypothetical protein